eukprot:4321706-Amphidinium_carterae.1
MLCYYNKFHHLVNTGGKLVWGLSAKRKHDLLCLGLWHLMITVSLLWGLPQQVGNHTHAREWPRMKCVQVDLLLILHLCADQKPHRSKKLSARACVDKVNGTELKNS